MYLLAMLAWWQLFLGAEERTCLGEWLNRWNATVVPGQVGPAPRAGLAPGNPNNRRKAKHLECTTSLGSKEEHLNSPQEVLGLEPRPLQKSGLGDPSSISRGRYMHCTSWDWQWPWTQQPLRSGCESIIFSRFESLAVRVLVLQTWAEKQVMW